MPNLTSMSLFPEEKNNDLHSHSGPYVPPGSRFLQAISAVRLDNYQTLMALLSEGAPFSPKAQASWSVRPTLGPVVFLWLFQPTCPGYNAISPL